MSFTTSRRVVITGLGVLAPNGIGKEAFWQACLAGRSGIRQISRFDASTLPTRIAGEIPDFNPEALGLTPEECIHLRSQHATCHCRRQPRVTRRTPHQCLDRGRTRPHRCLYGCSYGLYRRGRKPMGAAHQWRHTATRCHNGGYLVLRQPLFEQRLCRSHCRTPSTAWTLYRDFHRLLCWGGCDRPGVLGHSRGAGRAHACGRHRFFNQLHWHQRLQYHGGIKHDWFWSRNILSESEQ